VLHDFAVQGLPLQAGTTVKGKQHGNATKDTPPIYFSTSPMHCRIFTIASLPIRDMAAVIRRNNRGRPMTSALTYSAIRHRTSLIAAGVLLILGHATAYPAELRSSAGESTALVPDFSGLWVHPYVPGFELPASGPGPVTNRSRIPAGPLKGVSNPAQLVGDYTNPILKPKAAAILKARGDESLRGMAYPTPLNQCWPGGVPFELGAPAIQMLQQPGKITYIYWTYQFRQVRMNESHPARVIPSWFGDLVGHYEGDTLVIDTIGVKVGRFAMVDLFGTPRSEALHLVERYRLISDEDAQQTLLRNAKQNFLLPPGAFPADLDTNCHGRHLQLEFAVGDNGVFTTKWSALLTYGRSIGGLAWYEYICAENPYEHYAGRDVAVPTADKPDF
jgi:hypothetical protein